MIRSKVALAAVILEGAALIFGLWQYISINTNKDSYLDGFENALEGTGATAEDTFAILQGMILFALAFMVVAFILSLFAYLKNNFVLEILALVVALVPSFFLVGLFSPIVIIVIGVAIYHIRKCKELNELQGEYV